MKNTQRIQEDRNIQLAHTHLSLDFPCDGGSPLENLQNPGGVRGANDGTLNFQRNRHEKSRIPIFLHQHDSVSLRFSIVGG